MLYNLFDKFKWLFFVTVTAHLEEYFTGMHYLHKTKTSHFYRL